MQSKTNKIKKNIDWKLTGLEFENWICDFLPEQLNVSASKKTAFKLKFGNFAGYVYPLVDKAPDEFKLFFLGLVKRFNEIAKWKAPNGQRCLKGSGLLKK